MLCRKQLEEAVLHHLQGAAQAFLGRLEDQVQGAVEGAGLGQAAGGGEQGGGVAVVTAGVHASRVLAGVVEAGALQDRQGVHVGADAQHLAAAAGAQGADHPGAAQAAMDLVAPAGEGGGHQVAGALFLVTQFGMAVDVAAQGDHVRQVAGDMTGGGVLIRSGGKAHGDLSQSRWRSG